MNDSAATSTEKFKIPIEDLLVEFKTHLEIDGNQRILFSGKFGIGKTYALKSFFEDNDKYECFHLFPINYQISSSENILEFLKYDLLIELLKKSKGVFKKNDYSGLKNWSRITYLFVENNPEKLLGTIPKIGRPLKDLINLIKEITNFKKEIEKGEKGKVKDLLNEIKIEKVDEPDYMSELIKQKVANLKSSEKESILILDDLDRLDPEHIFRLLNIFSACIDKDGKNKFGFDKIIFVADYNNLKSIFHHKYGAKTDADGYFDKFFSIEVFHMSNERIIEDLINKIIVDNYKSTPNFKESLAASGGYINIILTIVLKSALYLKGSKKLSLRQLLKPTFFPHRSINDQKVTDISPFDCAMHMLVMIFGDRNILLSVLKEFNIEKIKPVSYYSFSKGDETHLSLLIPRLIEHFNLYFFEDSSNDINWNEPVIWNDYKITAIKSNFGYEITSINKNGKEVSFREFFFDVLSHILESSELF